MLRLLGLNPYLRGAIGIGFVAVGVVTDRTVLIAAGAVVALWSLVNVVTAARRRTREDKTCV